jgi:hypothetical protein
MQQQKSSGNCKLALSFKIKKKSLTQMKTTFIISIGAQTWIMKAFPSLMTFLENQSTRLLGSIYTDPRMCNVQSTRHKRYLCSLIFSVQCVLLQTSAQLSLADSRTQLHDSAPSSTRLNKYRSARAIKSPYLYYMRR